MTENNLITLNTSEKCWLFIGILLGIILTIVMLYIYTYLPKITSIQETGIACFITGAVLTYLVSKIEI